MNQCDASQMARVIAEVAESTVMRTMADTFDAAALMVVEFVEKQQQTGMLDRMTTAEALTYLALTFGDIARDARADMGGKLNS